MRISEASVDLVRIEKPASDYSAPRIRLKNWATLIEPGQAKQFAIELLNLIKQLELIMRYERRALSRRKFDIRELDALRRGKTS